MNGSVALQTAYEDIDIYTVSDGDKGGTWRGIFMAIDHSCPN
jgi:hypothetical protein